MPENLQDQIAAVWAKALGVKSVGPDDNFFMLGGHSLLGVKVVAEIQARTGIEEELRVSDMMQYPTLGAFTAFVAELQAAAEETGSI